MRILGRNKMYVKDALTIEKMAKIDTLVFDKTGTITYNKKANVSFKGKEISEFDLKNIKSLLKNSNHPLSKSLYDYLDVEDEYLPIEHFTETPGKGYEALVRGKLYKIGSASFTQQTSVSLETAVYLKCEETFLGKFIFKNEYRENMREMAKKLSHYKIHILSGDNSSEEETLKKIFPNIEGLRFNQSPEDKLEYIKKLQEDGKKVAMLGDGLNDAGALKQSNIGIAIADDTNSFTPSSDVIMNGSVLGKLHDYFSLTKDAMTIVKITFAISLLYNVIGLTIAVIGKMSPLVAAIIMPISSISVVAFTSLSTWLRSLKYFK